jgi:hypothetical protein
MDLLDSDSCQNKLCHAVNNKEGHTKVDIDQSPMHYIRRALKYPIRAYNEHIASIDYVGHGGGLL